MKTDPEIVEVPLSSEYLTDAGMYKAGYLWGRHIRKDPPLDAPVAFCKGVVDGYGDGMAKILEQIDENRTDYVRKKRTEAYWQDDQRG